MNALPPPVASRLNEWSDRHLAPAWLELDEASRVVAAGGALERYGLDGIAPGADATAHLPLLASLEAPRTLDCVAVGPDLHADVHVFVEGDSTWVLLLDNRGGSMVPRSIAKRLCAGERAIADDLPAATILFADIHEFSEITAGLDADAVVGLLNGIFAAFEKLAESHGLILIKTSGDSCEFVAGAPDPRDFHAQAAAELALDMQEAITRFSTPCGRMPRLRIGIHSGPIVPGLIGTRRLVYDIWGDSVRIASHMEEYGLPGRIQVTAATCALLRDDYLLEERGEFYVAGTGDVVTYLLNGRRVPRAERRR